MGSIGGRKLSDDSEPQTVGFCSPKDCNNRRGAGGRLSVSPHCHKQPDADNRSGIWRRQNLDYSRPRLDVFPGDCVELRWRLAGIASLHVDGAGKIGADEMRFCPDINATSPLFEVRAQNGIYRSFRLNIHHLPDLLFYLAAFATLIGAPAVAVYYLCLRRLEQPLPLSWLLLLGLL